MLAHGSHRIAQEILDGYGLSIGGKTVTYSPAAHSSKNKKRRKRKLKRLVRLVVVLLLFGGLMYGGYRGVSAGYQTVINRMVKIQEYQPISFVSTLRTSGVVVRDEIMMMATESGQVSFLVEDGTKVNAQAPVVEIQDLASQQQVRAKLAELEKNLAEYGSGTQASVAALDQQVLGIEATLKEKTRLLREQMAKTTPVGAADLEKEIRELNTRRLELLNKRGTFDGDRNTLISQKQELERQLSMSSLQVKAPAAGIVSYTLDGWETILKTSDLGSIGKDALQPGQAAQQLNKTSEVKAGKALFKVVADTTWYWVALLDKAEWEKLDPQKTALRLPGASATLQARVHGVKPLDDKQVMVQFAINQVIAESLAARHLTLEIIKRQAQGMVLPETALKVNQGVTGVYLVEQERARYRPVTVVDRQDGQVLVNGLPEKPVVVTTPSWVRDGQKVRY